MAEDELSSLLRERQRRAECEVSGIDYVPDTLAVRTPLHCDPAEEPRTDVLVGPAPVPEPEPGESLLPPPLIVRSPEVTVNCEVGVGSATASYGEGSIELYLDDISQLTRSELYRIAGNQEALQDALDANLEPLVDGAVTPEQFDSALIIASSMEAAAAAAIRVKALELRGGPGEAGESTGLYAIAELTALSRLVCEFHSEELWVLCDSEAQDGFAVLYEEPSPMPPTDSYRYRPAGFTTSTVSVVDANELAVLDAASDPTFSCVYVNEEQVVTCGGDVDSVFDFTYTPPFTVGASSFDTLGELGAHRRFDTPLDPGVFVTLTPGFSSYSLDSLRVQKDLVTSVTVAAGHFPSASQTDANEKARAWAARQLRCFFPSREAEVNCNNRATAEEGNPVAIRMQETGMTEAEVFAEMDSEFSIDPALVTNVALVPLSPGPGVDIDASEALIVKLPAGLVTSLATQTDADEEARLHAIGLLACRWVSPEVTCSCAELWSAEELDAFNVDLNTAVSSGTLSFEKGALGSSESGPLTIESSIALCQASLSCVYCNRTQDPRCYVAYDGAGQPYELWDPKTDAGLPVSLTTRDGVSSGVSAGLPAGVICDSDPRLVNTLAESTASLPPLLNNEVGAPVCRYGNREISQDCEEKVGDWAFALTPDSRSRRITVMAGSFEADSQTEADALAAAFLNASLICEFGNPPMIVLCGATSSVADVTAEEFETAAVYGDLGDSVAADSTGSSGNPLTIEAHSFTSLESPMNAKAQALLAMVTQLDCFWQSARIDLRCTAPSIMPGKYNLVPETGVISEGDNFLDPPREPNGRSYFSPSSHGDDWGEVYLDAKAIVSYVSQTEANRDAYDITWSQLDCFFKSAQVILSCTPPRFLAPHETLYPETATIIYGSEGDTMTSEPGAVVSYHNQADANRQAFAVTKAQLACDGGKDHVFGFSGFGTFACCKVKMSDALRESDVSKFYSPLPGGQGLVGVDVPGYERKEIDLEAAEVCGEFPAYFYLEAIPLKRDTGPLHARYYVTADPTIEVYQTEMPLVEGGPDNYSKVRRLIAYANQKDPNSTFNRGAKDDCADLKIVQAATASQKLTTVESNGVMVPMIVDVDTFVDAKHFKPHAFALTRYNNQAAIYYGQLHAIVTRLQFEKKTIEGQRVNSLASQPPIPKIDVHAPANLNEEDGRLSPTTLGWYGDVYLYWEVDLDCNVTLCDVRGPAQPSGVQIPLLDSELSRTPPTDTTAYFVHIGTIPEPAGNTMTQIVQLVSSDVTWAVSFVPEADGSSDSSDSSKPSSQDSSSDSPASSSSLGSSKDSAIVPTPDGYKKWYAMEAAGVIFMDFMELEVGRGKSSHVIDPIVAFCMEKGTMRAFVSQERGSATAVVNDDAVEIVAKHFPWPKKKQKVQVMLYGTRRGFRWVRLEHASFDDFVDNECRLNPRMTRDEIIQQLAKQGVTD